MLDLFSTLGSQSNVRLYQLPQFPFSPNLPPVSQLIKSPNVVWNGLVCTSKYFRMLCLQTRFKYLVHRGAFDHKLAICRENEPLSEGTSVHNYRPVCLSSVVVLNIRAVTFIAVSNISWIVVDSFYHIRYFPD